MMSAPFDVELTMHLDEQFTKAQLDVKTLTEMPSNDTLLDLYALFKQGSQGDATGKRPGFLDMVGRAKFDAWAKHKGTSTDDAKTAYIALVANLLTK